MEEEYEDVGVLLRDFRLNMPTLVQDIIHDLQRIRLAARQGMVDEIEDEDLVDLIDTWKIGWVKLADFDILDDTDDDDMCENLAVMFFLVFCELNKTGYMGFAPKLNTREVGEEGRKLLGVTGEDVELSEISLGQMRTMLYKVATSWYELTYMHHEILEMVLPVLFYRLLEIADEEEGDEEAFQNIMYCEMHLRHFFWPQVIKSEFKVTKFEDCPTYEEQDFIVCLAAARNLIDELMEEANYLVLGKCREKIMGRWEQCAIRELISRCRGVKPDIISMFLIEEFTSPSQIFKILDTLFLSTSHDTIFCGEASQFRQTLILDNIHHFLTERYEVDGIGYMKPYEHLTDINKIRELKESVHPYLIQCMGTYQVICQEEIYLSGSIEEALGQFLHLLHPSDDMRKVIVKGTETPMPQLPPTDRVSLFEKPVLLLMDDET